MPFVFITTSRPFPRFIAIQHFFPILPSMRPWLPMSLQSRCRRRQFDQFVYSIVSVKPSINLPLFSVVISDAVEMALGWVIHADVGFLLSPPMMTLKAGAKRDKRCEIHLTSIKRSNSQKIARATKRYTSATCFIPRSSTSCQYLQQDVTYDDNQQFRTFNITSYFTCVNNSCLLFFNFKLGL